MFTNTYTFNQDLGAWDVSSVTDMSGMFYSSGFNQDISTWDVSSVTDMSSMFGFSEFNQDIGAWDVSSVTDMSWMFRSYNATTQGSPTQQSFFQDISAWDVSSVTKMYGMFRDHDILNYDALLNAWSNQLLNSNVRFDAGFSQYSPSAQAARDILTNTYGWEISDGGVTP